MAQKITKCADANLNLQKSESKFGFFVLILYFCNPKWFEVESDESKTHIGLSIRYLDPEESVINNQSAL